MDATIPGRADQLANLPQGSSLVDIGFCMFPLNCTGGSINFHIEFIVSVVRVVLSNLTKKHTANEVPHITYPHFQMAALCTTQYSLSSNHRTGASPLAKLSQHSSGQTRSKLQKREGCSIGTFDSQSSLPSGKLT